METDDQFARWVTLFTRAFRESDTAGGPTETPVPITPGVRYSGVTPAAGNLLRAVDAGGVPAFVTNHLKQIAADNGIDVPVAWTPNEIVEAIRERATIDEAPPAAPAE